MKSIALILPYFGKFNNYFPLFLTSCRYNPTIDWHIYTDDKTEYDYPPNVIVHYESFDFFRERIQKKFNYKISLERPYKLCDYKPAYGDVLSTDLQTYDYWGHCDCDLIFGDIRHFLTDEVLQYDKVFTRGHLTLYKNTERVNKYYRTQNVIDIEKVYTSPKAFSFDEWSGMSHIFEVNKDQQFDELLMDDIRVGSIDLRPTKELSGKGSPYNTHNYNESGEYKRFRHIVYEYKAGNLNRIYCRGGSNIHLYFMSTCRNVR